MRAMLSSAGVGVARSASSSLGNSAFASTSRVTLDSRYVHAAAAAAKEATASSAVAVASRFASRRHFSSCRACRQQDTNPVAEPTAPEAPTLAAPLAAAAQTISRTQAQPQTPTARPLPSKVSRIDASHALSLLSQQSHNLYAIASLVGRTYLLATHDVVTVPRLRDVMPGDILHLDRIHEVGSRDYTLRAQQQYGVRIERNPARVPGGLPSTAEMRAAALRSTNSSLRAYAAGMPAKLGDLFNAGQSSLLGLIDVGSSHIGTDSQAEGAPQSIMQTAQALSLRQSRTSFGALVSSHGGLAHKGAVLPALIGAASTATTPSAERPLVQVEMTVLEHTKGPLERITKTKRRKGYKRTVQHKQGYTRLRVDAIKLVLP